MRTRSFCRVSPVAPGPLAAFASSLLLTAPCLVSTAHAAPPPRTATTKKPAAAPQKPTAPSTSTTAPTKAGSTAGRWTMATPDAMAEAAFQRAKAGGPEAAGAVALLASLADRASAGVVQQLLSRLGDSSSPLKTQAAWLAASLDPVPTRAAPKGLVGHFRLLGPLQDTGGRLPQKDIEEERPGAWGDKSTNLSWGVYDIRWRPVVGPLTARGVPLDVYVHPRKESCTYLASRIELAADGPVVVHVAASGTVRLIWDGATVGSSDEVHERALFDRFGAEIAAKKGTHLVAVKICGGSIDDEGRARLRLERPDGSEVAFTDSSDLAPLENVTFPKVVAKPFREPISNALSVALPTKKGERRAPIATLLGAALLRTKGGLEDLRSPRAPGLLSLVATDSTVSPDELALAGWISPFGGPRSGFLNAARDKATSAGDQETASFTLRRIAAARLDAGLIDWAMAALRAEPLASSKDAEAVLLRALVSERLTGEASRIAALKTLQAVAAEQGDRASVALWSEIAHLARGIEPKTELGARDRIAQRSPESFGLDRIHAASAIDGNAVADAVRSAIASGSFGSGDDFDEAAALLVRAGKDKEARDLLAVAAGIAPNVSGIQSRLAELLLLSKDEGDRERAERALLRARDLEPGDARLKAEIALRSREKDRAPSRDERFLATSESILARKTATPAKSGEVFDRQLYWQRVVTLHDDRRISQLIHYAREVVIPPRSQDEMYEPIPAEGEETEILKARVHRAGGGEAFAEEQKSDFGRPMIRWPDLKTGDVVEVVVRSWTSGPIGRRGDAPFYFLDFAGSVSTHPLLFNEVVIDSPKARPLAVDIVNGKADRVVTAEEGARTVTRYIWDHPLELPDEPLAPKASETFPTIMGSTFPSWDAFRTWYLGAVEGFTEPDDQVRTLAAELTKGKRTRDEKLEAIFDFVADDIRYVNYVSGEWWLPNRPSQLLARRQGDCDDKAILLITLLKCVGIDATEVLIQTRHTGQPSVLLAKNVAIPLFDHGIAYLPGKNGEPAIWLDATSPQSRLGPVPSMDARTYALFATEGPAQMVATPKGSPDDYGAESNWDITLAADGSASLVADEVHRGDHAFYLRSNLREKDARAPWVEQNLIAGWIPQVSVEKDVDFQPDVGRGKSRVRYQAKTGALGRRDGDDLLVTLAPSTTLTSQLAPLPERTLPVALPPHLAPSRQTHHVKLHIPEGMTVPNLPPGGEEKGGEFGNAKLTVERDPKDPRVVVVTRDVVFDLDRIPVEKYKAWRGWLSRTDSLMHRSVRFVAGGAR
jgi:hypothetical protein